MTAIRDRFKLLTAAGALAAATAGIAAPTLASAAPAHPAPASSAQAAPSEKDLHPGAIPGGQEHINISDEQLTNVREIVKAGQTMNLPPRAQVIAVATAMQESKLHNIGNLGAANDHDSEGLFQQRPSSGWGTSEQITNPAYATTAFLKGLKQVDGWQNMPLTQAAQKVQVSAYPDAYAQWEKQAGELVDAFYGHGPYTDQATHLK
jgi:Spy/CpxP family protein refolding chaperone